MGETTCERTFVPPPDCALSKAERMDAAANGCASLRWYDIVIYETRLKLSFQQDTLPALRGLAKHMQEEQQCEYFARLWEDTVLQDLL